MNDCLMNLKLKFLVMDVDGTLTDGKVYIGEKGELFKAFDIKDGCGIKEILPKYGIIPVIITARKSVMLQKRCKELSIKEIHQDCREKYKKLKEVIAYYSKLDSTEYTMANVAYVGDDLLDLKCMLPVKAAGGLIVCPSNAINEVKRVSDFICINKCGEGAVREFIDCYVNRANGDNLNEVKVLSQEAYNFIMNFSISTLKDGCYKLGNGIVANVMTYITKPISMTYYESHRKYINIQYMIYGEELVFIENVAKLSNKTLNKYDEHLDTVYL